MTWVTGAILSLFWTSAGIFIDMLRFKAEFILSISSRVSPPLAFVKNSTAPISPVLSIYSVTTMLFAGNNFRILDLPSTSTKIRSIVMLFANVTAESFVLYNWGLLFYKL